MNTPKLYTVKEAAKIIGVSTNTLYKYLDDGKIKAARGSAIQGRFRIPEVALEEFLGIKLSPPEPVPNTPSVEGVHTPRVSDSPTRRSSDSLTDRIADSPTSPRLPTKIARALLFLALLAMLVELFLSPTVSATSQLLRFIFLSLILILAYQDGGYRKG